jgi:hypothetical protein
MLRRLLIGLTAITAHAQTPPMVDAPIDPADAQTPWRYLGIAADPLPVDCSAATAYCPAAPAWSTTDLFAGAVIPPGLQGFCAYESDTGLVADLEALVSSGCLEELDPDVMAVTPLAQAQPYEALVWPPLRRSFLNQAGQLPEAAVPTQPLVRISILDTQPTAQPSRPGNSLHGFTLARMADELICPGEKPCGVDIRTRLALPYIDFCRGCTDRNGGYFGTIGGLAVAVREAVAAWVDAGTGERLVLNLSVGWDPRYGTFRFTQPTPVPVLAVLRALQDASCRGAVTVAAAGNRLSGPENTPGPLLPAGWERLGAPGFGYCRLQVEPGAVDQQDFPTGPAYRPLVHAAGAVDLRGDAVLARALGEPPRAAYGLQAVADAQIDGQAGPTQFQTGTSVAALVVSAAAAASWHYGVETPAWTVMNQLYAAGTDLGRAAQFCFPPGTPSCQNVSRIRVCDAVAAVCAGDGGELCPPPGSYPCPDPGDALPELPFDEIATLFDAPEVPQVAVGALTQVSVAPAECGAQWRVRSLPGDLVDDPCPQRQYYAMQATPWTNPQPASQPCPTCTGRYASPGELYLEIAPDFQAALSDVTLVCGNVGFRLPNAIQPLATGDRVLIRGIPEACADVLQVAWRVLDSGPDDTVSASTAVFVYTPDAFAAQRRRRD